MYLMLCFLDAASGMEVDHGTLVAITIGFCASVLLLWGTKLKRTEIFGHAFLFAAIAFYFSGFVSALALTAWKYKIDRPGLALLMSGIGGWLVGPWLKDALPKILNKKAGLDD